MNRKKICVIITTRGNYAKMKSVIQNIQIQSTLELQLIVGGGAVLPKYGNIIDSMAGLEKKIDRVIHFLVEGENPETMSKSAGLAVIDFTTAFENLRPDVVMVIADRFECLAIAMAASYMNIPIVHLEGGEISGSIDESIRHAITKLSHLHFPATEQAAKRIERMGEDPTTIFSVGSTSLDVIKELDLSNIKQVMELQKTAGVGVALDLTQPYLVVIQHPVTTEYEKNLVHINETIGAINSLSMQTVWIWPNMDAGADGISKGIRIFRELKKPDYARFYKSLPIEYFAPLIKNSACIIGNSSCGIREAAFLGVPSVNIGSRQLGRERGLNVKDVGYDAKEIKEAILQQIAHGPFDSDSTYGEGHAGAQIAEIMSDFEFKIQKKMTY
jgi:UDP-hydrolysing UDP-N-acetyl-D-glucosamine 2-epimerase